MRQLETLGTNFMWVSYHGPSDSAAGLGASTRTRELSERDFQDIEQDATALAAVTRIVVLYTSIFEGGRAYPISLVGADGEYARVRNLALDAGRAFTAGDIRERHKVCLLASSLAAKFYGKHSALGRTLKIEDFNFDVVGVFRDVESFSIPTELSENAIIIPLSVLRAINNSNRINRIYGQARGRALVDRATRQVSQILAGSHGEGIIYRVGNLGEVLSVSHRVSFGLIVGVAIVSAISLVVGGVGIMNIMLVTVRERTPEIGIRKALGARPRQILDVFLLDALVISLAGGVLGTLIGCAIPVLLTALFNLKIPISCLSIIFALGVSAGVGIFFGYFPALRAARLDPVQALRYE